MLNEEKKYDLGIGKLFSYDMIRERFLDSFRLALAMEPPSHSQDEEVVRSLIGLDNTFTREDFISIIGGKEVDLSGNNFERIGYYWDKHFGNLVSARSPDFYQEASRRYFEKIEKTSKA